jgi:hypothetical protein
MIVAVAGSVMHQATRSSQTRLGRRIVRWFDAFSGEGRRYDGEVATPGTPLLRAVLAGVAPRRRSFGVSSTISRRRRRTDALLAIPGRLHTCPGNIRLTVNFSPREGWV